MDVKWNFVVIKTFQKALTRQISEAVRTRTRGEHLILNSKGVYNRCAVPELAVLHNNKIWEDERRKFVEPEEDHRDEDEDCITAMINAKEDGKKRKKEEMAVKVGKRRKKEVWCGAHGEGVVWVEAGGKIKEK